MVAIFIMGQTVSKSVKTSKSIVNNLEQDSNRKLSTDNTKEKGTSIALFVLFLWHHRSLLQVALVACLPSPALLCIRHLPKTLRDYCNVIREKNLQMMILGLMLFAT